MDTRARRMILHCVQNDKGKGHFFLEDQYKGRQLHKMNDYKKNLLLRASILGVMSGMRAASGVATLSRHAVIQPDGFAKTVFKLLASPGLSKLITLGQIGEMAVDKLPFLPSRTEPQGLIGRMFAGGVVGAAVLREAGKPMVLGILIGASSALVSSFAFYLLRRETGKALHLPDPIVAVAEDAAVFGFGALVNSTYAND
jgi:uncharacterized membrane protein